MIHYTSTKAKTVTENTLEVKNHTDWPWSNLSCAGFIAF